MGRHTVVSIDRWSLYRGIEVACGLVHSGLYRQVVLVQGYN